MDGVLRCLAVLLVPIVLAASACDHDLGLQTRRDAPVPTAATARGAAGAPQFAPGHLEQHFAKHGAEMGFATKEDYLRAAQALVGGGPGVETFQRGGDTLFFKGSTDEFAVLGEGGVIRTYFKPSDGQRYWERQRLR